MRRARRYAAAVLPLLLAARLSGQEATAPVTLPPRVGVDAVPTTVRLDDLIRTALEQNPDVTIARLDVAASQQDVRAAEGLFDPRLTPSFVYERAVSPTVSTIGGSITGSLAQRELAANLQMSGRTPWLGNQFTVDFTSSRLETNNQFSRVNPQFPSSLAASFTQPLLRNLGIDTERRQILLARRAVDLTDSQLAQVAMEQISLIEQAFWELTFAVGNVGVQADALQQARTQVASNERQVEQGTLAPVDVVEARTQVASLEQAVASAQQALTEAENQVKMLVLADRSAAMWNQALLPAAPQDRVPPTMSIEDAVQRAINNRPELAGLAAQAAQNTIDRQFYGNQARPQVDLVGSYTLAGLAGSVVSGSGSSPLQNASDAALLERLNDLSLRAGLEPLVNTPSTPTTVPAFLQGGLSSSLANVFTRRFPTVLVQLQVDLPFRNRTALGNVARADIEGRQLQQRRLQLEQAVEADVRNAMQRVTSAQQRLASAGTAQRSAREQYESERRRFDSGLSTVFLVLQRQTALVTAQGQELRARADLNEAVAVFDRAIGDTLTRHGVALPRTLP